VESYKMKVKGIREVLKRDHMKVAFFGRWAGCLLSVKFLAATGTMNHCRKMADVVYCAFTSGSYIPGPRLFVSGRATARARLSMLCSEIKFYLRVSATRRTAFSKCVRLTVVIRSWRSKGRMNVLMLRWVVIPHQNFLKS
jgi:hypothetical protein